MQPRKPGPQKHAKTAVMSRFSLNARCPRRYASRVRCARNPSRKIRECLPSSLGSDFAQSKSKSPAIKIPASGARALLISIPTDHCTTMQHDLRAHFRVKYSLTLQGQATAVQRVELTTGRPKGPRALFPPILTGRTSPPLSGCSWQVSTTIRRCVRARKGGMSCFRRCKRQKPPDTR